MMLTIFVKIFYNNFLTLLEESFGLAIPHEWCMNKSIHVLTNYVKLLEK